MIEEFVNRLNNNEYISNYLFEYIKNNNRDLIPNDFNIDNYNNLILDRLYMENKEYFDNMYKGVDENIHLDEEQCKAILADEKYSLIIAGAGTGKTTTMTSKVKYLVDKKGVDPSKILVMSYTKKATMELEERIVDKFNIPACVTTFHSLGYKYIKRIFGNSRKCIIIDGNEREQIFLEFFKKLFEDKSQLREVISLFSEIQLKKWYFSKYFIDNYEQYNTYDEFFEEYKKMKIDDAKESNIVELIENRIDSYINGETIRTLKNEIVRSKAEAIIANFLFKNGIPYEYEKVYSEVMDDNTIYRPDFTVELAGEEVYIEYFGLDDYRYNIIKKLKEEYHRTHHNRFISLDKIPLDMLESVLDNELRNMGVKYHPLTSEKIYDQILSNNPLSQLYPFVDLMYSCVEAIKKSLKREEYKKYVNDYINNLNTEEKRMSNRQFYYIEMFYAFYNNKLYGIEEYKFDYSDLLYYSNKYIDDLPIDNKLNFEYIIIDEYQDISKDRYDLAKKTADKNNSNVFAVGDDWQSIYAFSGSRIDYIYNFNQYFKNSKMFRITNTYRNSQELIDVSGEFIMKNENQISKQLISNKHIKNPIKFVEYDGNKELTDEEYSGQKFWGYQEYDCLEKLILKIHQENPEHNILVLGRTNNIIKNCFKNPFLENDLGTKIEFVGYDDIQLEGMTMHKSKGLTFDEVIIIGLNKKFPSDEHYNYWLIELFENPRLSESIPFAEERRLFYVALTRTKNNVYLLVDSNERNRSPFIDEIKDIIGKV